MTQRNTLMWTSLAGTCLFVMALAIHEDSRLRDLTEKYKVEPEYITTHGLQPPVVLQNTTSDRFPTSVTYWTATETNEWLLLNGPYGTATCPDALGEFGAINAPDDAVSPAYLRLLATGFKDKALELQVVVPRFNASPKLDRCPGFSYEAASGLLMVGDKPIAYLTPSQPRLVAPSKTVVDAGMTLAYPEHSQRALVEAGADK